MLDYVADVMSHWLAAGADGWRLDAAYAVPTGFWARSSRGYGTSTPRPTSSAKSSTATTPSFVRGAACDAVTQYELWKATWSSLNDRNFYELAWALRRHHELPGHVRRR